MLGIEKWQDLHGSEGLRHDQLSKGQDTEKHYVSFPGVPLFH